MEEKLGYLSDVDLFRDLSERDMAELDRMTTITNVARGRVFYQPGQVQLYRIPRRARNWSSRRWDPERSSARWRCWDSRCTTPLRRRWRIASSW